MDTGSASLTALQSNTLGLKRASFPWDPAQGPGLTLISQNGEGLVYKPNKAEAPQPGGGSCWPLNPVEWKWGGRCFPMKRWASGPGGEMTDRSECWWPLYTFMSSLFLCTAGPWTVRGLGVLTLLCIWKFQWNSWLSKNLTTHTTVDLNLWHKQPINRYLVCDVYYIQYSYNNVS